MIKRPNAALEQKQRDELSNAVSKLILQLYCRTIKTYPYLNGSDPCTNDKILPVNYF